ncbi:MAG: hypothetical protein IH867_11670 [Chloroflexi bacterium]|nr:hypothetical protein [Chloroflexota bacterium]
MALFRYVANPNTLFKNIASVPPGSIARVDTDAKIHIIRYWKPEYEQLAPGLNQPESETNRLLKETIDRTIRSQFVSDVKAGLQLSGGVDSSLIAWAAEGTGLEGYSAIPTLESISEEPHIDHVCNSTSIRSNKVTIDPESIGQVIGEVAFYHETPINHEGSIGIYLVCRQAHKDGTTVLLSAEGADELFGGYHRYRIMGRTLSRATTVSKLLGRFSAVLPRRVKTAHPIWSHRENSLVLTSAFGTPELASSLFPTIDIEDTVASRSAHMEGFGWNEIDQGHLVCDQRTCLVDLLARQDKMSMAH